MNRMTKLWLDPRELNHDVLNTVHGVNIAVGLSPFDVPDSIQGRYDEELGKFLIEFNYLTAEDRVSVGDDSHPVQLFVGKQSQRLYAIIVDVQKLSGMQAIMPEAAEAISVLQKRNSLDRLQQHYAMARNVIRQKADGLLAQ